MALHTYGLPADRAEAAQARRMGVPDPAEPDDRDHPNRLLDAVRAVLAMPRADLPA